MLSFQLGVNHNEIYNWLRPGQKFLATTYTNKTITIKLLDEFYCEVGAELYMFDPDTWYVFVMDDFIIDIIHSVIEMIPIK